jgi:hypothetical protein
LEPLIMLKTMGPVVLDLPPEPPPSFWRTRRFWLVTLSLMFGLSSLPLIGLVAAHHTIDLDDLIPAARLIQATPTPSLLPSSSPGTSTGTDPDTSPSTGTSTSTEPESARKHPEVKLQISTVTVERPIRARIQRTVQRARRRRRSPVRRRIYRRRSVDVEVDALLRKPSVDVDAILQAGAQ